MSDDPSPDAPNFSVPLSREEWRYANLINVHVGSLTPLLKGRIDCQSFVKQMLTDAQARGLDPQRIYRAAAILPPAMAARMPAWHDAKPASPAPAPSDRQGGNSGEQ